MLVSCRSPPNDVASRIRNKQLDYNELFLSLMCNWPTVARESRELEMSPWCTSVRKYHGTRGHYSDLQPKVRDRSVVYSCRPTQTWLTGLKIIYSLHKCELD
jgi:hypothetical protein